MSESPAADAITEVLFTIHPKNALLCQTTRATYALRLHIEVSTNTTSPTEDDRDRVMVRLFGKPQILDIPDHSSAPGAIYIWYACPRELLDSLEPDIQDIQGTRDNSVLLSTANVLNRAALQAVGA